MASAPRVISEENGFTRLPTDSVSSLVFLRDGDVYKINARNSLERQREDLKALHARLAEFTAHLPETRIQACQYEGKDYTCVVQPRIVGKELKALGREAVLEMLGRDRHDNRQFLRELFDWFFEAVEKGERYPDIVGNPADQDFFGSVNLLLDEASDRLMLCDVGLSPHEDTLRAHGSAFYESDNVKGYASKLRAFADEFLR